MKKSATYFKYVFSVMAMTLFSICLVAQTPLYSVSKNDDMLRVIDTTNYSVVSSIQMTSPTGIIDGCNGLAVHPCTGEIYIIIKTAGSRWLGKVDPATGIVNDIGDLLDNFAGIAFDSTEALYGVTGDGAFVLTTLYLIDTTNAATFLILPLGNGNDGETIAYNPDDGLMYHFSGYNGGEIFESIDLGSLIVTPIPWTNPNVTTSETFGPTYNGNGSFLIAGIEDSLYYVDNSGFAINPGIITPFSSIKGLGYKLRHVSVAGNNPICSPDSSLLIASTGDSYQWYFNGTLLVGETSQTMYASTAGNYNCYITNGNCADTSDVFINLLVDPTYDIIDPPLVNCIGDSTLIYGNYETVAGTYYDSLTTICGFDSVHSTILTEEPSYFIIDAPVVICNGDSALIYGNYETLDGPYYDSLTTINGCDSIHTLNLIVNPTYSIIDTPIDICTGDSALIYGNYETTTGTYYDTYTTTSGCDSIFSTILTVTSYSINDTPVDICIGDSTFIYGNFENVSGTYYDSLLTINGCDSVHNTILTVNPTYSINNPSVDICDGDSALLAGNYQTVAGIYVDTNNTVNGCDSIVTTQLIVNPNPVVDLGADTTICDTITYILDAGAGNSSYLWQDNSTAQTFTVTGSGTYYVDVVDANGCTDRDTVVIQVDPCVGIDETSLENTGLLCYPNPTAGSLTIELMLNGNHNAVLTISDVLGSLVYRKEIPWRTDPFITKIDLSSRAKGVYMVALQTGTEFIRQRIVVQ